MAEPIEKTQLEKDQLALADLMDAMVTMRLGKPEGRSERARAYAVVITQLEMVFAYFKTYIIEESLDE